jgi:hypothetical protein
MFQTIPLNSEMLSRVAYENGTLYATFRHGNRTYAYFNVPADVFNALLNAESRGRFFQQHIFNHYKYMDRSYARTS